MIEIGRRSFLRGLAGALITAPAIVRSTSLMPVRTMTLIEAPAPSARIFMPGTATVVGDIVMQNGAIYVCTLAGLILSPLISEQVAIRAAAWSPS